jgi:hypothetical protein
VLPPDVLRALTTWREMRPNHAHVFADEADKPLALGAGLFREHLLLAGVKRPELHDTRAKDSVAVRVHDLRALFVTVSIAQGRTEHWIRDRTAHRTLTMIDTYRRQARLFAELNLGDLVALDEAIPELRKPVGGPSDGNSKDGERKGSDATRAAKSATLPAAPKPEARILDPLIGVRIPMSEPLLTADARIRPTDRPTDPVEEALATGIEAIAASMANASPAEVVQLADRMASVSRELEARRLARSGVVDLEADAADGSGRYAQRIGREKLPAESFMCSGSWAACSADLRISKVKLATCGR